LEATISHDEMRLAARCDDRTVHRWDIPSGHELLPPLRHGNEIVSFRFSPDDQWLITASQDGSACL
jgi:WD40 repeat protein